MNIAVAIPVRNEEESINELLDSLLNQSRHPDEIIIADGGSHDKTVEIIRERIARGEPIRLLEIGPAYPGRGRNEAVKATNCEWIAFIDAGVNADKFWLERLAARVQGGPTDIVLGNYDPILETFFSRCAALSYVAPRKMLTDEDGVLWRGEFIASTLVRRALWERVGGFPEHLRSAEDQIFLGSVRKITTRIAIAPDAMVYWKLVPDLPRLVRKFTVYSRSNILAGLYKNWQRAVVRRYGLTLICGLLAGWWAPILWVGLTGAILLARTISLMKRKPEFLEHTVSGTLRQFFMTAIILGAFDYSTFKGMVSWLWNDVLMKDRRTQKFEDMMK